MDHKPTVREYLGISLFWFALSFFWGAMLTLVLPERVQEMFGPHEKDKVLALVASVGAFMATSTQILFGALSDRSRHRLGRRRPYLIVGTVLASLVLFTFPPAHTLAPLLGAYIAIQFFLNVANGPYQALIPDRIPFEHQGTASAYMGVATLLGRIGGPLTASRLLLHPGDAGLFRLMLVFAVLLNTFMIINVLLIHEEPPAHAGPGMAEALRGIFKVDLMSHPSLVWLLVSRMGIMMGVYTVSFCMLYYIGDTLGHHADATQILSYFMVLLTVTGIVGTLPAGVISDRYSKKMVLYIANTISIVAGLGFVMAHALPPAYLAVGVFGLGFGAFSAVDWALVCNLLPSDEPAKYMGIWSISDNLPQILAPLIAGPVAYVINAAHPGTGYRVLMALAILYFVLGTIAIRFIQERTKAEG